MQPRSSRRVRATGRVTPPPAARPRVELVLYVSTSSSYAAAARRNCEALLARFDRTSVEFEICDVSQHPERAETDGICYTPALMKRLPLPRASVIGDLSNPAALIDLLAACGVKPLR